MKKLYRRSISGLMALLICFTTILGGCITAFAASSSGEVAKSYSIGFPRSGDANLDYSGTWGHDELHYISFNAYSATRSFLLLQSNSPIEGLSSGCLMMPSTADR